MDFTRERQLSGFPAFRSGWYYISTYYCLSAIPDVVGGAMAIKVVSSIDHTVIVPGQRAPAGAHATSDSVWSPSSEPAK